MKLTSKIKYYTKEEYARKSNLTSKTVRSMIKSGLLDVAFIGNRERIKELHWIVELDELPGTIENLPKVV